MVSFVRKRRPTRRSYVKKTVSRKNKGLLQRTKRRSSVKKQKKKVRFGKVKIYYI